LRDSASLASRIRFPTGTGRAASKPGHVRYAPVATKFTIAAK
jgi:hypothetical protein